MTITLNADAVSITMTRSEFAKLVFCLGYSETVAQKKHVRDVQGMARSLIGAIATAFQAAGGKTFGG